MKIAEFAQEKYSVYPAEVLFRLKDNRRSVCRDDEKRTWRLGDTEGGRGDGRHSEDVAGAGSQ